MLWLEEFKNLLINRMKRKFIHFSICSIVISLCIAGCHTPEPFFTANFDHERVAEGMRSGEVVSLIGKPQFQEVVSSGVDQNLMAYRYVARLDAGGGKVRIKDMTVVFKNDIVIQKNLTQKLIMKPEKDSRPSNNVIQLN